LHESPSELLAQVASILEHDVPPHRHTSEVAPHHLPS
jgi:hypothetical protein